MSKETPQPNPEANEPRDKGTIDWAGLKREFLYQTDHATVRGFLRSKDWTDAQVMNGNTLDQTSGWSSERASIQQQIAEDAYAEYRAIEKSRMAMLLKGKLNLLKHVLDKIDNEGVLDAEESADLKRYWEIIKTELGEPTSINKTGIFGDREAIDQADKELRDIVNEQAEPDSTSNSEEISQAL